MTENLNLKTVDTVDTGPFRKLVMTIGELPTAFVESMTYYELLAWFTNYLETVIIPTVNNNGECVEELQQKFIELDGSVDTRFATLTRLYNELKSYVDNYFDNLDVQEEINNKLDQMTEDGTLQEIITTYLQSNVTWTFDTVADMKQATNLVAGSYAKTLGYHSINDGGGATYYITDSGTANERDVIAIDTLYANLVDPLFLTPEMFGAYGDDTHDDTAIIQHCIDYVSGKPIKLMLIHLYLVKPTVTASNNSNYKICFYLKTDITIEGMGKSTGFDIEDTGVNQYWAVFYSYSGQTHNNVTFKNFKFYQRDNNVYNIDPATYNPRYILDLRSQLFNLNIENVLFDHVYSRDVIMINNNSSSDVNITGCVFNFVSILNRVSSYDCSIAYMKCINYTFNNNFLDGDDYTCFGGLECHGYNGIAKDNKIFHFKDCINIQPSSNKPANIIIENNTLLGYDGIILWENVDTSDYGIRDIRLLNNFIQIEASTAAPTHMGGIRTNQGSTFTHPIENLTIHGNTIEFINIDSELAPSGPTSGGIVLNKPVDQTNLIITDNTILNSILTAIFIGTNTSSATHTLSNIIIKNNIIKNNAMVEPSNLYYSSTFFVGLKYLKNVQIKDNIIVNDIEGVGSHYVLTRLGTPQAGYECMFAYNSIKSVNDGYLAYNDGTTTGFIKENLTVLPLISPGGTKYYIKVADDGTLSTTTNWGWN